MSADVNPRAGKVARDEDLVNVAKLVTAYYTEVPDPREPEQQVSFGTSGHRGSALTASFNEAHILATTQAICDFRKSKKITGPLFLGKDTHALSEPAFATALEVLGANDVTVMIDDADGYTPTPAVSHAILTYNADHADQADGIVVTPSHNPPTDGGFKYNPPNGGPADTDITGWIQDRANEILAADLDGVELIPFEEARRLPGVRRYDFTGSYVADLPTIIDIEAIREAGVRIGVDPLGGAALDYWLRIAETFDLDLTVVNQVVDPTFRFMTLDWDGKIRMDCSSPYAMESLIAQRANFDIAVGNDTDSDRHGIVAPSVGLMNPNHYLAVAIEYLFTHRPNWPATAAIGKTLVSSSMIDRVAESLQRRLVEVPVGFKWFVDGLIDGSFGFGGEESAGASFLRRSGSVWTTDKDGIVPALLAAEICAVTGADPGEHYRSLTERFGDPHYRRIDAPASRAQKDRLKQLSASSVGLHTLAGEPVTAILSEAPGNGASIGGIKVTTASSWFAARPSGTEDVYKIYAETFQGPDALDSLIAEAQKVVDKAIK